MFTLLKQPFFGRFMVKWINPLAEEQKKDWQPLRFASKSGGELRALYAKAHTPEAKATIVLAHPMGKEAKGFFLKTDYPERLRREGYHLFVFDFNGFGESSMGSFAFYEDVVAASVAAKGLFPELPLGYHGVSLGGQWATIAFADPAHLIDFAIVESAATSLPEFWKQFPAADKALKIMKLLAPRFARKVHMIERIKGARGLQRLLFIYTEADEWMPVEMGQRFQQNSPLPAELWTVPDAKHAQIHRSEHKEVYSERIFRFYEECLAVPKA